MLTKSQQALIKQRASNEFKAFLVDLKTILKKTWSTSAQYLKSNETTKITLSS